MKPSTKIPSAEDENQVECTYQLEFCKLAFAPDFMLSESKKQCIFKRFQFNITINKKSFRCIYLLDITVNPQGALLPSTYFSQLSRLRNQPVNYSHTDYQVLYHSTFNDESSSEKLVHFFMFIHQRKYLIAVFSFLDIDLLFRNYGKSQGLYDMVTADEQLPLDTNTNSENEFLSNISDELVSQAVDMFLNVEKSSEGEVASPNELVMSWENHEKKLQHMLNEFLSNPSFDCDSVSFAEFDLESTSYVVRRIAVFHNVATLLNPMVNLISNPNRLVIFQNPYDCRRTFMLRKALNLEVLTNDFTIDIVADENIRQYQTLYSPSANSMDVAKRTVGEYLRLFPCTTLFYLFDEKQASSRPNPSCYIIMVKDEQAKMESKSLLQSLWLYFLARTTIANTFQLELDSFIEIIVETESNLFNKATNIVPPVAASVVFQYEKNSSNSAVISDVDSALFSTSYSLYDVNAPRQFPMDATDFKRTSEIRSDKRSLIASISTYLVCDNPRELYLLTTGHKLPEIPTAVNFADPQSCVSPTPALKLVSSIWPKYHLRNATGLAFAAQYRPPTLSPSFPILVNCICDIAIVKCITSHVYSYKKEVMVGGSRNNGDEYLSLPTPNEYLGKVQLQAPDGDVVELTTVGAGHRAIYVDDTIIYQPLYISNCTEANYFGYSGCCIRDGNNFIHSFYVGELARYHVSTPATIAIRQAENMLSGRKLNPTSSFTKPSKCSIC